VSLLWQKIDAGTRYEVRTAGNTRRLYTDGVLHTEYNPTRAVTGSVWDLLMLPAFLLPTGQVRRVLVLGVGGGAVVHLLLRHVQPRQIVGVDLDANHLQIAKQYFDLHDPRVRLHKADALRWLRQYRGGRFDMIIEDLFAEKDREPVRAVVVDQGWMEILYSALKPQGCLVMNFINREHLRSSALYAPRIAALFTDRYVLSTPATENRVAVLFRSKVDRSLLRTQLRRNPELSSSLDSGRLRYCLRAIQD